MSIREEVVVEARETSGATMCLVARYVRERAGEEGLRRVHAASGIKLPVEALEDEHRWFTFEDKIALFEATAAVLDDAEVTRHIGESALLLQVGAGVRVLLRTLGSPRVVLSNIARASPKFSSVATMKVLELGKTYAIVSYELRRDKVPNRLDCLYNQGLISVIGPLFGMPLLEIEHPMCQVRGAPQCVYRVQWPRRRRARRRAREAHLVEQSAALAAQLEALQSTAADLVSSDDISEVLARIVARAGVAVSAPRYLLAVRDQEGRVTVRSDGFASSAEAERVAEELIAGRSLGDGALVQPVASARRDYGVLAAFDDEHSFFDYERDLFAAYARNAAAALDVVASLDEARRRSSENAALLGLASTLAEIARPEEVAQQFAEAMLPVMSAHATIVLLAQGNGMVTAGIAGAPSTILSGMLGSELDIGSDEQMLAWLANPEPRFVLADSPSAIARTMVSGLGVDTLLVVPINRRGKLLGVSGAGFVGEPSDPAELLTRAISVADYGAIALDNAALLARVTHQALHDDLTGADTPSHFEEETERALARAASDTLDVSFVFVDLDRFKEINDEHGHPVGDQVLREVARRIRAEVRVGDFVGRLGGDEFAVLLATTGAEEALAAAERIRRAIEEPIFSNEVLHVSASIGVTTAVGGESSYGELLRRADGAMYAAKRAGRNACVAVG